MSYQHPDRICVEEILSVEIAPQWAVLKIEIQGTSQFLENDPIEKAEEVVRFLQRVEGMGYPSGQVSLETVTLQATGGMLSRSSTARFHLKLKRVRLDLVPKILLMIADFENIEINNLAYDFGELRDEKAELRLKVCQAAKEQAREICDVLGAPLIGLYSMNCEWRLPDPEVLFLKYLKRGSKFSKVVASSGGGLNLVVHEKDVLRLTLKAEFKVGEFKGA